MAGRPRKIKTASQLKTAWEEFKHDCDNQMIPSCEFSSKSSAFITEETRHRIAYSIEGFCNFLNLTRSAFYDTYEKDTAFSDIVTRMREECEVDTVRKLQTSEISSQLGGLLLSRYGYGTKIEAKTETHANVSGAFKLESLDLSELSDDELRTLNELARKITAK